MKKHFFSLGLVFGLIASGQEANTLLWKFYKKGQKPSYLYGTYHSKKITHDDYNDSLDVKIKDVDRVYVELDQNEMSNASQLLMSQFILPAGTSLQTLLKKEEYERYVVFAKSKMGDMYVGLDQMHPLMVSLVLETFDDLAVEQDTSKAAVDQYIEQYALAHKVEVKALETAEEQTKALKAISMEESVESLMETVDLYHDSKRMKEELERLYKNEDLKGIVKMINDPKMKETMEALRGPLIETRNKIMVERVDKYIVESNKTALVAVGALHLVGKTGLIEGLKSKGYKVEPVLSKK